MAKNQQLITPEGKIRKLPNGQYQIDKIDRTGKRHRPKFASIDEALNALGYFRNGCLRPTDSTTRTVLVERRKNRFYNDFIVYLDGDNDADRVIDREFKFGIIGDNQVHWTHARKCAVAYAEIIASKFNASIEFLLPYTLHTYDDPDGDAEFQFSASSVEEAKEIARQDLLRASPNAGNWTLVQNTNLVASSEA